MGNPARDLNTREEYWQPPVEEGRPTAVRPRAEACEYCGTEFVVGSRFCHVCGAERQPERARRRLNWARLMLAWSRLRERLGLNTAAMVALAVGLLCALTALGTGLIYTANTILDWQAVQLWRVQWLLAALAAFTAGVLLKR